jgi:1,4-dihydroxy-6-naphthoate synthase
MTPLSLTISPCPNDTFVFHAWVHGLVDGAPPVRVRYADVDEANGLAVAGDGDVLKVSYGVLPWALDRYSLLPAGGAVGRGCGPLLLSAAGGARRVAVPGERTTAYLLFRLWAGSLGVRPQIDVVPFERIMPAVAAGEYDAGLVIHEARFTYPDHGLLCLVDLGEWWERETGLPVPLGAILCRRTLDPAAVTAAIRESLRLARAEPERSRAYVLAHAQEMKPEVVDAHIALYVTDSTAGLDAADRAAVTELFARSAAAGITPPLDDPFR